MRAGASSDFPARIRIIGMPDFAVKDLSLPVFKLGQQFAEKSD